MPASVAYSLADSEWWKPAFPESSTEHHRKRKTRRVPRWRMRCC